MCQVLNGGADVFRCIAAEWKNIDLETVDDTLRQQAKQVHTACVLPCGDLTCVSIKPNPKAAIVGIWEMSPLG